MGLEPIRHKHTPLKRACLPIPAHSQVKSIFIIFARRPFVNLFFRKALTLFHSLVYNKEKSGCSAVGSAPALGAGCRGFESLHSDHVVADCTCSRRRFLFLKKRAALRSVAPPLRRKDRSRRLGAFALRAAFSFSFLRLLASLAKGQGQGQGLSIRWRALRALLNLSFLIALFPPPRLIPPRQGPLVKGGASRPPPVAEEGRRASGRGRIFQASAASAEKGGHRNRSCPRSGLGIVFSPTPRLISSYQGPLVKGGCHRR